MWKKLLVPPTNEVCEDYVFTRVCQSFCSWGGGIPACLAGGIPACLAGFQAHTKRRKLRGLAGGASRPTPGGVGCPGPHLGESPGPHPGGCIPACTEADPPPPTATTEGGTHPTGMNSYFRNHSHYLSAWNGHGNFQGENLEFANNSHCQMKRRRTFHATFAVIRVYG